MPIHRLFLLLTSLFLLGSCQKQEPVKNLSYTKRKKVDSLFKADQDRLDSLLDIECIHMEADNLLDWVDSLYERRMIEIDKLRNQKEEE